MAIDSVFSVEKIRQFLEMIVSRQGFTMFIPEVFSSVIGEREEEFGCFGRTYVGGSVMRFAADSKERYGQ